MVHEQTLAGIVLILTWNKTLKLFQICTLFVTLKNLYDVELKQLQDWVGNFLKNYICKIPLMFLVLHLNGFHKKIIQLPFHTVMKLHV